MNKLLLLILLAFGFLVSCVGTDEIDDSDLIPVEEPKTDIITYQLLLTPTSAGLMIDDTIRFSSKYITTKNGVDTEELVTPVWASSNTAVATIDQNGLVTAITDGTTDISAMYESITKKGRVNVVLDTNTVADVVISKPAKTTLEVNNSVQLTAKAFNVKMNELASKTFTWSSTNSTIISVDAMGLITTKKEGSASIVASSDGVESSELTFSVNKPAVTSKTATFSGNADYDVSGTASLFYNENDDLILEFSNDFKVSSFGAAIYVYMAPQSTGVAGGVEISQLTSQGGKAYNISEISPTTTINTYDYVIIHCKPYNIPFGQSSKLQ